MQKIRLATIIILFFNAVSGLFGGLGLIIDPSGKIMQMPIEWLDSTPFTNFLIPGIILFIFIGLFSLIVALLAICRTKHIEYLVILEGVILLIWLTVEIVMLKLFYAPLHIPYFIVSLCLLNFGYLLIKNKRLAL